MERLTERPGAEQQTGKNTGERNENAPRHGVFRIALRAGLVP